MSLTPGTRFGPYEIQSLIGAGGMGEVYRAHDTRLDRAVAIKILPDTFVADPERVARFEREAQILAALNHPNIAAIHGLDESSGAKFLVLELVEGESLDARLKPRVPPQRAADGTRGFSRAIPVDEALAIARQIIDALEAAHDKGIIHRDLKPANIMLTPDGQVKVLDFGLGKYEAPHSAAASGLTHSPTLTFAATQAGVILGTAAYMAPEQAKGRAADKRCDVWAFGCVLYEMVAGRRAFDGEDVSDVLATVLKGEPEWTAIPADVPGHVTAIIRKCLSKDRKQRIPDMSVVRYLLNEPPSATPAMPAIVTAPARTRTGLIAGAISIVSLAVGGGATWLLTRQAPPKVQHVRFSIVPPASSPFDVQGFFRNLAISPDGANVAYVVATERTTGGQLVMRAIDQLDSVPFRGIDNAGFPFFSPDGHWVGFFAGGANGELKKVAITGGPAIPLCRYQGTPRGADWGANNVIVFATNDLSTGLMTVPAGGGEPKVLTKADFAHGEQDHLFPTWLPDGRSVLYTSLIGNSIDNARVAVLDVDTGRGNTLVNGGSDAQYVRTGHLVYASAGTLRVVGFDPRRREVLSDPVPIVEQVMMLSTGAADFRISQQGTLVYVPGSGTPVGGGRFLVWVNRQGREEPIGAPFRRYSIPRLSPDATRVALDIRDQENDIWIWDFARKTLTRLTVDPSVDSAPVWMPDGRRIVFASAPKGASNIFWQTADGTGTPERLTTSPAPQTPSSISPDGKILLFTEVNAKTGPDIMQLRLDGSGKSEPVRQTAFIEVGAEISPDGRWIAYHSLESGQQEVYVRPFPKVDDGRWQISTGGGSRPAWSRNGRELFYLAPNTAMMSVPVQTNPSFSPGSPSKLFDGPWYAILPSRTYDVSPDGQRFLMIKDVTGGDRNAPSVPINVVVHWTEELKARVPAR